MTNPPSSQGKERSYEIPYCQTFHCSQSKWTGNILGAFVCVYQFLSVCPSVCLSVCLSVCGICEGGHAPRTPPPPKNEMKQPLN